MKRQCRVTGAGAEQLLDVLSQRDRLIVSELARLRVATAGQLERLCFGDLGGQHRDRSRRRVLARLVSLGVLASLERRIGGVRAGSSGLVFVLDLLGQRVAQLLDRTALDSGSRPRRPGTVTERFLLHSLSVSELYVRLREATATGDVELLAYLTEPACWWTDSTGQLVKPDASLTLATTAVADDWVVEVDRATESLPTLRTKLVRYTELLAQGETGPSGALPRVLVTVPDEPRQAAVASLLHELTDDTTQLIHPVQFMEAGAFLLQKVRE